MSTPQEVDWWDADAHRERSRRRLLGRQQIVDAALRVADRDGIDGLNMRRVAEELATGAASLYRHVPSKEILLDLVFDAVLAELPLPDPSKRWRRDLRQLFTGYRTTALRHNDVARLASRPPRGPNTLRAVNHCLGILRGAGFSPRGAVEAYTALANYTTGFLLLEIQSRRVVPTGPDRSDYLRDYLASQDSARLPYLVEAAEALSTTDDDQRYHSGLAALIRGLQPHQR